MTFGYTYVIVTLSLGRKERFVARTGRPTQDPKTKQLRIRFSEKSVNKLEILSKKLNLNKADTIRYCLDFVFDIKKE